MYTFSVINFPHRTTLAVPHKYIAFLLLFSSVYFFLIFLVISSLTHGSKLYFFFPNYLEIPVFLLLSISSLILFWSENYICIISIIFKLVKAFIIYSDMIYIDISSVDTWKIYILLF